MTNAAAFFDLDRTLMAGSSGLHWARAARSAGLLTRRRMVRYGWQNVKFRLQGSTDSATDRVRREVGEMIAGQRVVDLQRLAPKVLAGVLVRVSDREHLRVQPRRRRRWPRCWPTC